MGTCQRSIAAIATEESRVVVCITSKECFKGPIKSTCAGHCHSTSTASKGMGTTLDTAQDMDVDTIKMQP